MNSDKRNNPMHRPKGSKGKRNADFNAQKFFRWYYKNVKEKPIPYSVFKPALPDLLQELTLMIIETGSHFYIPGLGYFYVRATPAPRNADGSLNLRKLPVDFKSSKEEWAKLYPGKTEDEIAEIPNKPLVYFENALPGRIHIQWYRAGNKFKNVSMYKFKANTGYDNLLGKSIKKGTVAYKSRTTFKETAVKAK